MRRTVIVFGLPLVLLGLRAADGGDTMVSTPLPERHPRSPAAPLFTRVPATESGVTVVNRYDDPRMWGIRYPEFAFGSVGSGIALGDYDDDGRPDIFVVGKTGTNRLYRNLGDWRFADVTETAGVGGPTAAWKTGAVFVDVNNDRRLDLFVCRVDAPNLLYLNRGDGAFVEGAREYGLDTTDGSAAATFGDYDRDGWLDLYLITNLRNYQASPGGEADRLFRNRGDGTFEDVTRAAGIGGKAQGHSALWWDVDDDGWPDIYATNDYDPPDQLWRNQGDGTFRDVLPATVPYLTLFSMGSDLGDVNNDGRLDLFVADMMPTTRSRDQRSLAIARAHSVDPPAPAMPPQVMRNALLLNSGTGHFLEAAYLAGVAATDWTWSVLLEDFDCDGRVDLHVTNGMIREFFDFDVRTRLNTAAPSEVPRIVRALPVMSERNLAFRNRGELEFEDVSAAWGLDETGVSFGAAVGDLDGDGDLDLVYANHESVPSVCRNECDEGHRIVFALRGTASNRFGVGATVRIETTAGRQIRRIAVGRGYASSGEPVAHFGLGGDDVVRRAVITWPSGQVQSLTNLVADRRYEITEPPTNAPTIATERPPVQFVEVGDAVGLGVKSTEASCDELAAQPLLAIRHNRLGPGMAVGDVSGDGIDDVVFGGGTGEGAKLLVAGPDGTFFAAPSGAIANEALAVPDAAPLLFDADGDGRADLLLAQGGAARPANDAEYRPRLFPGRGGGTWLAAPQEALPPLTASVGPAIAADFDRDGRLDVFLGGRIVPGRFPETPRSVLLANRGGKFTEVTADLAPGLAQAGMVAAALWSDVDGDGWIDLLLALEWGTVRCWRNIEGTRFEDVSDRLGFARAGAGWWNSLAAGDLDGDGRLDYVAGNLGLNTRYQASVARPAILLSGGFDDTGRPQLIEVESEGDRLVPVRSRLTLGRAMPGLLKKFPTAHAYATAGLDDVFAPERIAAASRREATEFRSGVFFSQRDGSFRFEPLPRIAQIAPIFGIAVADFDGDGRTDIFAVQNSFAPIAEVGRFSGGLGQLLLGDGSGNWRPVPPAESGLVVPGDAKGLALLDVDRDGWPEVLVTRNNDRALAFGNTGVAGRQALRIVLRGRGGNPTCVGARITLELADGSSQTGEIAAGSGYLSQSSAACFVGFPDGNPPRRLRVRWPSGQQTEHAAPSRGGSVAIRAP